jgi:hypothetical protein
MDFKKDFTILAEKYNLNYQYQDFKNCFGSKLKTILVMRRENIKKMLNEFVLRMKTRFEN